MDTILYSKLTKLDKKVFGNSVEITPTTISGLNFVKNATAYTSASNYKTVYFPLEQGAIYIIEVSNVTSTSNVYFREVISSDIPGANVSGSMLKEITAPKGHSDRLVYFSYQNGYFGIALTSLLASVITVHRIDGLYATEEETKDIRNCAVITPILADGLTFNQTTYQYESSSGYETWFFPVKEGVIYHINCKTVDVNNVEFKRVFTTTYPANSVYGTPFKAVTNASNTYRAIDYVANQDGFYGIVFAKNSSGSIDVTSESGVIAEPLRNGNVMKSHYLSASEFAEGSCSTGLQYPNITDCIAQKEFYVCDDIDKIYFEDNDTTGPWKIRALFFDENTDYLKQFGYGFYTELNVPTGAKYCKIAISHYNQQGTSSVTTTPWSVTPGTLKISVRTQEQAKHELFYSEREIIEETGYSYLHADFVNGVLSRGSVYSGPEQYYRVCSDKKFLFDRDIVLIPDSGYQFGIHSFGTSGESFISDSGWQTKPYMIPAGTYFKIVIQRTAATIAEIADVNAYVSSVKVSTKLNKAIDMVSGIESVSSNVVSNINYAVTDNDSNVFTSASGYQAKYYCVDAGKTYCINATMGERAGYIRFVFSEKIPAENVVGNLNREIYFKINQTNSFFIKPERTGYFSIVNHTYYPYTNTFDFVGLNESKPDKKIPAGLPQYSYLGEKIDIGHRVAPEALFVVNDGIPIVDGEGVNRAKQGATVYGDILFIGYNGGEYVSMHNLITKRHICNVVINTAHVSTYHCNNINFGVEKYDPDDPFPLLYIAMENPAERKSLVYRITGSGNAYSAELVQTITYPSQASDGMWYPNGFIDTEHGYFYIHGYTENSFYKSATNKIKIVKYALPLLSEGNVQLSYSNKLSEFIMDSYTATQGCIVKNDKMYQCNGFGETDNNIVQNSLTEGKTVTSISLIKMGIVDEPEAAFIWRDQLCFYTVHGYVYRLHFD